MDTHNFKPYLLKLCCLIALISCGDAEESNINNFEVNALGDGNEKVDKEKIKQYYLSDYIQNVYSDKHQFSLSLTDFLSEKYLKWIEQKKSQNSTLSSMEFICTYDTIQDNVASDVRLCSSLHPGIFNAEKGIFSWQEKVDNGTYEFWLFIKYEGEELLSIKLHANVEVLRITVMEVTASWFDENENLSNVPVISDSNSLSNSIIVAIGIFKNPDQELLTAGSNPKVNLSDLDAQILKNYLITLGYDQEILANLTQSELVKMIPRTRLSITNDAIYFGAQLSNVQYVNFALDHPFKKLKSSEKQVISSEQLKSLKPDIELIKKYLENALAIHFGDEALSLPASEKFSEISSKSFEWDINRKAN